MPKKSAKINPYGQDRYRLLTYGLPVPLKNDSIPVGYIINPNDSREAIPVQDQLELLLQARSHLRQSPYSAVSDWLKGKGLNIDVGGLKYIMKHRPPADEITLPLEDRLSKYGRVSTEETI